MGLGEEGFVCTAAEPSKSTLANSNKGLSKSILTKDYLNSLRSFLSSIKVQDKSHNRSLKMNSSLLCASSAATAKRQHPGEP